MRHGRAATARPSRAAAVCADTPDALYEPGARAEARDHDVDLEAHLELQPAAAAPPGDVAARRALDDAALEAERDQLLVLVLGGLEDLRARRAREAIAEDLGEYGLAFGPGARVEPLAAQLEDVEDDVVLGAAVEFLLAQLAVALAV